MRGGEVEQRIAQGSAAFCVARPATTVPVEAVGAGVVAAMVGVGLRRADLRRRRAEHRRGDLPVHGGGAVAEFGGADGQVVAAVAPSPMRASE